MSRRFHSLIVPGILVLVFIVALSTAFRAQGAPQNADTLSALLVEVRGLRAAMEQMASAGPRVQLAFGRLQIHEQRVSNLVRRLDVVRERIRSTETEEVTLRDRVTQLEGVLKDMRGSSEVKEEAQANLAGTQKLAARAAYELQQLQAEESSLAADIAAEQARWTQINQQLEELERSLVRR